MEVKEYLDICLIKLLTQQNLLTATLSAFSSLKSQTFCTKPSVAPRWLQALPAICSLFGFIDNLKTLFHKRNKKTWEASRTLGSCFPRISRADLPCKLRKLRRSGETGDSFTWPNGEEMKDHSHYILLWFYFWHRKNAFAFKSNSLDF